MNKLEEKQYHRLSNLTVEEKIFDINKDLKPGDCLVAFSVKDVHRYKNLINRIQSDGRNNTCSIIYGSLPPENKKEQTRKFNKSSESEIKYLCATNAVFKLINLIFDFFRLEWA